MEMRMEMESGSRLGTGTRCPLNPAAAEVQPGVPSRNGTASGTTCAPPALDNGNFGGFSAFFYLFFFPLPFPELRAQLRSPRVAGGTGTGGEGGG